MLYELGKTEEVDRQRLSGILEVGRSLSVLGIPILMVSFSYTEL